MHFRLRQTLCASLLCYCGVSNALVENYLGIVYKYRHMPGRTTSTYSTEQALPARYNGGEIYYEHRFFDDVGVHIGYEQSANKHIDFGFSNNQLFIGPPMQAGSSSSTDTRIRAVQFDMVGYLNLLKNFEAVGQFGFSLLYADINAYILTSGVTYNTAASKGYKFVPRVSFGAQYFFGQTRFGVRVVGDWEGTNLYRMKMTDDDGVRHTIRPFKQSWCVTAGLVLRFLE